MAMKFWVDLDSKLNNTVTHSMLSNSYRRVTTVSLTFGFPFYGHIINNVTIATGGFLYLGETVHNWLAATQYIAPLMANFDTSLSNTSNIRYFGNATVFVVEWKDVQLKEKLNGTFSFQAILKKNGDIIFVYKNIPTAIPNIPDEHHPVKVGISDAYVIDKTVFCKF